jgi:S1-C subfamily serine protease
LPPTPTPTPSILNGISIGEKAMVKLTAGSSQWSGVMIDPSGVILTTSLSLGTAPLVSFRTFDGHTGRAWVVGRDDNLDLAVLEVLDAGQQFEFVEVSAEDVPTRSEELILMYFRPTSTTVTKSSAASVVGSTQDPITGVSYIQVGGFSLGVETGGAVFDARGQLRGLRMDSVRMIEMSIGRIGEAWAMDSFTLASAMIARLRSGLTSINASAGSCTDSTAWPPVPAIYMGGIIAGGSPAAAGLHLYVRVIETQTNQEMWFSKPLTATGRYFMPVSICDLAFGPRNAGSPTRSVVEFWLNASSSSASSVYRPGDRYNNDLVFP